MARGAGPIRKRIAFDHPTWNALDRLAKDRMVELQDLADEAFPRSPEEASPPRYVERNAPRERPVPPGERSSSSQAPTLTMGPDGSNACTARFDRCIARIDPTTTLGGLQPGSDEMAGDKPRD
jgi:hypothetical protein